MYNIGNFSLDAVVDSTRQIADHAATNIHSFVADVAGRAANLWNALPTKDGVAAAALTAANWASQKANVVYAGLPSIAEVVQAASETLSSHPIIVMSIVAGISCYQMIRTQQQMINLQRDLLRELIDLGDEISALADDVRFLKQSAVDTLSIHSEDCEER